MKDLRVSHLMAFGEPPGTISAGFVLCLAHLVEANPDAFYRQDWWLDEPFAWSGSTYDRHPDGSSHITAGYLAHLYLHEPDAPRWTRFIWTDDYDSHGNRVYVGGVGQYGCEGFQIHRLLVPDERWVEWEDVA